MRAWWPLVFAVACWRDAPAARLPAEAEANEPAGPPPVTRLVRADPPPPTDPFGELMAEIGGFVDQMCQCSDRACAYALLNDIQKWWDQGGKDVELRELAPTQAQAKQLDDLSKRMAECATQAMSAGSGSAKPTP
ncbi:MAG TPA: hypothetical protein VGF94_02955 [Kofleriaceae bacterium]|jgi:hypothetical protein